MRSREDWGAAWELEEKRTITYTIANEALSKGFSVG